MPAAIFQSQPGSTAVFVGNVTGLGAFTGTGAKDFEGGTSVNGALQTTIPAIRSSAGQLC
jgi:hypothetical protein